MLWKRLTYGCLALATMGLALSAAHAVVTATWSVSDYKEFDKGESENAFITSLGEVKPGWQTSKVDLDFEGAWAAIDDGDATYVGSDDKGTVYKITGNKVAKLASIKDAVAIVSLAKGAGNTLYAGTMPAGQIWTIHTKSGKSKLLTTLKEVETVWSLALSKDSKTLYAGTGPGGTLFSIQTKNGKSESIFSSDDKRIMALELTGDGSLWMGTSDQAQLFRYSPKTKETRAIADFAGNEISAIVEYRGDVAVIANDLEPAPSSGTKTKEAVDKASKKKDPGQTIKKPKENSVPGSAAKKSAAAKPPRKGARKGKGAVYRVQGDGQLTQLHALTNTYFSSLAVTPDNQLFAGSANEGSIYLVDDDHSVSTAFDVEQRFIAQILWSKKKWGFVYHK